MRWQEWWIYFPFSTVFFSRKLHFFSLFSINYSMILLRYFWQNYSLNSFSLLYGLLRLDSIYIGFLIDSIKLLHHDHRPAECRYIFWWHLFFNNRLYLIATHQSVSLFEPLSFSFFSDIFTYELNFFFNACFSSDQKICFVLII